MNSQGQVVDTNTRWGNKTPPYERSSTVNEPTTPVVIQGGTGNQQASAGPRQTVSGSGPVSMDSIPMYIPDQGILLVNSATIT